MLFLVHFSTKRLGCPFAIRFYGFQLHQQAQPLCLNILQLFLRCRNHAHFPPALLQKPQKRAAEGIVIAKALHSLLPDLRRLPNLIQSNVQVVNRVIHMEPCTAILSAIKWVLERTPPELAADVMHNGIYITGGGSLLYGMDQMIASELGIPVLLAKEPMDCAALGLGNIIENFDLLQHLGRTSFLKQG